MLVRARRGRVEHLRSPTGHKTGCGVLYAAQWPHVACYTLPVARLLAMPPHLACRALHLGWCTAHAETNEAIMRLPRADTRSEPSALPPGWLAAECGAVRARGPEPNGPFA